MPPATPTPNPLDEMGDVIFEAIRADRDHLLAGQRLERLGQLFLGGQLGLTDQDRDDQHPPHAESADYLPTHPVVGVVETSTTVLLRVQPIRPDDRQQHVAAGESIVQGFCELLAGADSGMIEPDRPTPVVVRELAMKPARMSPCIAPAIADEDPRAGQTALDRGSQSDRENLPEG